MASSSADNGEGSDQRFEFMGSFVQKTLKLKPEKWQRLITVDEHKVVLKEFLDRNSPEVLIIVLTQSAQLLPITSFPLTQLKSKGVFFIKKHSEPVPKENCKAFLIVGDLATRTIDQLSCLVDEVFVPLLSNEDNHDEWPEMVAQDVKKHVHNLKSTVYQVKGQVNGQTILAMPVGVEKIVKAATELTETGGCEIDLYLKGAIEGVVIKWVTQIHDVMEQNPSNAFLNGQNPLPSAEINFWNDRLTNLMQIYEQLRNDRIHSMAMILEFSDSAYFPSFRTMFKNVVTGLAEAKDISCYLNPLQRHFTQFDETDFAESKILLKPLIHVVCLVWSTSRYYCQSSKIIVLLRQVVNMLIYQAKKFLDPSSIFHTDIDEAMQRLTLSLSVLKEFRLLFDEHKDTLDVFFKPPRTFLPWTFHPNAVFDRFNAFIDRLHTIQWFFCTVIEFLKLEKIEIGGIKGRQLSSRITAIYVEFNQFFAAFASKTYDVLDPDDNTFNLDFAEFQARILELDMKLAAILCQAFDDCHSLESVFKLISIVGSVLDRPKIREEFTNKYTDIVQMLNVEIGVCEEIYNDQMIYLKKNGAMLADRSFPPVTTSLHWIRQLGARLTAPMRNFQALQHPINQSEPSLILIERYEQLMKKLDLFEESVFSVWTENLKDQIESNLIRKLIVRRVTDGVLMQNFHPELVAILREVHHMRLMEKSGVPEIGLEFAESSETYWTLIVNLDKTIDWYNRIVQKSTTVELNLIQSEIDEMDKSVETGIVSLTWNSENIMEYLLNLRQPVETLQARMQKTQQNIVQIRSIMSTWIKMPLFERKDGKKDTVLCLEERNDRITRRYAEIREASNTVHSLLNDNLYQFGMAEKQESPTWRAYVAFVDDIVYENLLLTVGVSMGYIADQMDPANSNYPLFESRLELLDPIIVFVPSLDPKDPKGFNHLLADLIDDITKMSSLVVRLCTDLHQSYEQMISKNKDMQSMKGEILEGVEKVVQEAADFCNGFERYSYLWLEEREFSMELFLKYGRLLEPDEIDLVMAKESNAPEPNEPTIEAFREQIDHYESLFQEIEGIESLQVFNSWFQVDVRPFRQAIMNIVRKWGNMFKNHLVDRVTSNLCDLGNFIRKADEGLLQTVVEGDYNGLVNIMAYLMHVKERALTTDEMFEPMQETIDLLKYYDMDIPEEVNVLLQELPEQWANTKKIAITVKQQVAPLQATEVVAIRNRIGTFDSHIAFYREVFKSYSFFNYDCEKPFRLLDGYSGDLQRLESVMRDIQSSGSLFEVNVPEFKLLKQCRKELKMLKQLWDYIYLVRTSIEDWKLTPWRKIDVENMDIECKKFAKDVRLLDKEMRSWDAYTMLESTVKNMLTSLRAVGELQNSAIRERHWIQLMASTKVPNSWISFDVFKGTE